MQPYAHHLVAVVQANNQLLEEPSRVVLLQSRATAVSRKGVRTYGMDAPTYISSMLKPQAVLLIPPHHMLSTTYTASGKVSLHAKQCRQVIQNLYGTP